MWNREEIEIDLYQCVKVLIKRKMTFVVVLLFFFAVGFGYSLFLPKTYKSSILLQSSVGRETLITDDDIGFARSLRVLIINGAFNEALSKRLSLDPDKDRLAFDVVIPDKTNILQVSIGLEISKKEFGVVILRNLADLISERYAKQANPMSENIANQIEFSERFIAGAKEKTDNLWKQMKETTDEEGKLRKEIKVLNAEMMQTLTNLEALAKERAAIDNSYIILARSNFIRNKLNSSDRLSDQLDKLSIRKDDINFKIRDIDHQINGFRLNIEKLSPSRNLVPKLKILSQPRVSPGPIRTGQGKILVLMANMGVFFGVLAVFLQEFLSNKDKKS